MVDGQRVRVGSTGHTSTRWRWLAAVVAATLGIWAMPVLPASADPVSPLVVTNTATPSPATSGEEILYTISVTNSGGAKVTNVVLTDQLNSVGTIQSPPAAPQYVVTTSQGTCTQSGQLVSCNAGTLGGGASMTVTVRGVVNAPAGSTINNTATITATKSAQNFTTTASVQTLVEGGTTPTPMPDLTLNKTGPSSVQAGADFDYTLTVNNIGTELANDIVVKDTLPAGVSLQAIPFDVTSLFTCSSAGDPITVTCIGGRVNAGQNGTIRLHVTAPASGPLTNTAVVDPDNAIVESNELNNTSATVNTSVTSAPQPPSISLVKTDDPTVIAGAGPDPVYPTQTLTYKLLLTNTSTTRADDVTVVDGTQGLEAASIVATQTVVNGREGNTGGCSVSAAEVTCRTAALNAGGTISITITGTVIAPAGTTLINTATATANIKNTGVKATATERTTVKPQYDLTITKVGEPDPVCANSWPAASNTDVCVGGLKYTFVVGNSGIQAASNVVVRDPLPTGVVYDSFSNSAGADFACALGAGNVLTCTNPSIGAESTESFSIIVMPPAATGPLTNTVTVDPGNAIYESDETNNNASATVQVSTGVDLVVYKQDLKGDTPIDPPGTLVLNYPSPTEGFDPIATSGTQTYTIYVDNLGTQNATDVRVEDTLPAGTKFLSVTGDEGFTCSHDGSATGGTVTCVGAHLDGTAQELYAKYPGGATGNQYATIIIKVFATPFVQPVMHNEVRVDPQNAIAETNEANNFAFQDTVVETGGATKGAFNQLTIAKEQSSPAAGAPVATNGTLRYLITVGNDGTDPVENVVVTDTLPSGSRFVSAFDVDPGPGTTDAFTCAHDGATTGGVVTCTGGDFSGSVNTIPDTGGFGNVPQTRTIQVTVFAPNDPGTYANTAQVDPGHLVPEGNEFDNAAQATTVVKTAGDGGQNSYNQLSITKGATAQVATNSPITYTLTVSNSGTNPAFGVDVRDALPAGTTFISATDNAPGPNQFTCTQSSGVVTCSGATLSGTVSTASGAPTSRVITITAFSPDRPMTVTNTAYVDPNNTIPEGDETDNHATASTLVVVGAGFIDLQLTKCDQGVTPGCTGDVNGYNSGDTITYEIEVRNAGTDPAFQVMVRDPLPAGMTFVSAVDSTGGDGSFVCYLSGGTVTCSGGTLDGSADLIPAIGQTRTISIVVTAPQEVFKTFTNQAFVDPLNTIAESNETNNSSKDTLTVASPYNLRIVKDGPTTAQQNNTEDYVLTVFNDGALVNDVVVVDPLPVGLIPLGVEADGNFTCEVTENPVNTVTCTGDMAAASNAKITIHVFITQESGTIDNEACVDPDNAIVESDETDNCSTKVTGLQPPLTPNISVHKSVSAGTVSIGDALTYTISVSNVGNGSSAAFDVTDDLPADLSIVGTPTATNGFATCVHDGSATGGTVTCSFAQGLAPGQSSVISIQATVTDSASGPIINTATANNGAAVGAGTAAPCDTHTCSGETATDNNTSTVVSNVGGASIDLAVGDITDTADPVAEGDQAIYTVTVTNAGSQDAKFIDGNQAVVQLDLPTLGISDQIVTASQGFICVLSNGNAVATCSGDLLAGQSTTITAKLTVGAASPDKLTVTVTADPMDAIAETDETNNSDTETTTVILDLCTGCVDIALGQIVAAPNPVPNGDDITYEFTVTNIGDMPAVPAVGQKLVVTVNLDTGFNESSLLSASATNGFTCSQNPLFGGGVGQSLGNPELICESQNGLTPGAGTAITVHAHVATAATPSYVDFDVATDATMSVGDTRRFNNDGGLQVDVIAP